LPGEFATTAFTRAITVAEGVYAPGHLGELTQYLPFELVDDVLEQTQTVQRRLRQLPSRVGVYFVLALALFPTVGYLRVWDKLVAGLAGLVATRPSEKALRELRRRVGPAPFKSLFEVVAGPLAQPSTPGVCYRRWRTVAFDGCSSLQAPDQPRIRLLLGKIRRHRGLEGYPHLRLMALCETGTRGLLGAVFGPTATGEIGYARRLLPLLDKTMLLLADRGFDADEFLTATADTGAQLLIRLKAHRRPAVAARLPDGSFLTRIRGHTLRIIDAHITLICQDGRRISEHYRLATTLLDHRSDPAPALVRLYHERWEIESAFLALRHTLFTGRVLRSADPAGLEQELWALLTVYQTLRAAMVDAVETRPGTNPDRASFTVALHTAANQVITAANIIPTNPAQPGPIGAAVLTHLLPARRSRTSARKVKSPMSRYSATTSTEQRPPTSQPITRIDINTDDHTNDDHTNDDHTNDDHTKIDNSTTTPATPARSPHGSHPGRRDRTLQLLRTDPHRNWRPTEIAHALGIAYQSLCAQMGRWVTEGLLDKTGRGSYRLNPQWLPPPPLPAQTPDSTHALTA
jgi:hypothetical protein